jgi:regulator of sigma E protease
MLLFVGLFLFVLLVVLHEYGHFLVAKRNGVEVEEFGVGFPPKLFGKKLGKGIFEGYYTVNLLPLGGFVRLKGEHDSDKSKGAFGSVSTSAKLRIMLAGVAMNLVTALILFTGLAWLGMPQVIDNQFTVASDSKTIRAEVLAGYVEPDSPAAKAGLTGGSQIVSLNGKNLTEKSQLRAITSVNAGKTVPMVYQKNGVTTTTNVTLLTEQEVAASLKTDNPKGYLGVAPSEYKLVRSTWSAPVVAVGLSTQLTGLTLKALGQAVANLFKAAGSAVTGQGKQAKEEAAKAGENVSGPVGIYAVLRQGASLGYQFVLFVVAIISLTLAIMNALPIPALDGGRAAVMLAFRAAKKPLKQKTEEMIHGIGFATLMVLFVVITIVDIRRFF